MEDLEGSKYCDLMLDYDYVKNKVHLSIPGYVDKALQLFKQKFP